MSLRAFVHRHRVAFAETNLVGNVYFAHYLMWQGHTREHFLAEHAPGVVTDLQSGDLALVTVSCTMDYYAECFASDEVAIAMTLRATSGNRIHMAFDFRRGEELAARGTQSVACMARAGTGMVPVVIPAELSRALKAFVG